MHSVYIIYVCVQYVDMEVPEMHDILGQSGNLCTEERTVEEKSRVEETIYRRVEKRIELKSRSD